MMKKRPAKKHDPAPTGMLDAYTEGPAGGGSGMSDSDKFREGYKKKGKGKGTKAPPPQPAKKEEVVEEPVEEEVEQELVEESWDDEVVDSWEQMEVEQMPVPVKVRREEKKKRKELEKSTKHQEKEENSPPTEDIAPNDESSNTESFTKESSVPKEDESPVTKPLVKENLAVSDDKSDIVETKKDSTDSKKDIVDQMNQMTINQDKKSKEGNKKELSAEEVAAVKSDREAKKAAKAAKVAAAQQKKAGEKSDVPTNSETVPDDQEKKTKEELKAARKAEFEAKQKAEGSAPATSGEAKSKAELKAERRAKQEAQRASKENKQQGKPAAVIQESRVRVSDELKADDKKAEKKLEKTLASQKVPARTPVQKQVALFSHLYQYKRDTEELTRDLKVAGESNIHPAVLQLGLQYAEGKVTGSTERAISLLLALKSLLIDLVPTIQQEPDILKEIDNIMKPNITFLKQCRPLSISMGNAIRYLKKEIQGLDRNLGVNELKENIVEVIDDFININFVLHPKAISETANKKIKNGDTILTFSHSKLVEKVLLDAANAGKKFKVVVTEARVPELPAQSGARSLARLLVSAGVHTTYLMVTALEQIMDSVTMVMLGCEGVMANGCVLATVGTSQVALLASAHNKPVLVCCETYKFSRRVQTDSFVYNELSDPADLTQDSSLEDQSCLSLLNLVYDLTPASLVSSIITESSQIPPTSVPVILRLNNMMESDITV